MTPASEDVYRVGVDEVDRLLGLWQKAGIELFDVLGFRRGGSGRLRRSDLARAIGVGERQVSNLKKALTPRALAALCVLSDLSLAEGLELLKSFVEKLDSAGRGPATERPERPALPPGVFLVGELPESPPTRATAGGEPAQPWEKGWHVLREDLECARHCLDGGFFEAAIFHAHFAASAAVHQLAGHAGGAPERITDLLAMTRERVRIPQEVRSAAARLDKHHLPLHYLSPLPPTRSLLSDRQAADDAIAAAERILAFCEKRLQLRESAPSGTQ